MTPILGEIRLYSGNQFVPDGWALCNGQLLDIPSNEALYSLLGTIYGGDGRSTFGLPNLGGRVPVNTGQAPGMSNYVFGSTGGVEQVTLTTNQLPQHNHTVLAANESANSNDPTGRYLAKPVDSAGQASKMIFYMPVSATGFTTVTVDPENVTSTGGSQPHPNLMPYITLNYIICLNGVYPSFQ